MSVMKYEVGDKVRVRSNLKVGKYGDTWSNTDMVSKAGEILTIASASCGEYKMKEFPYFWNDEMLEPVCHAEPYFDHKETEEMYNKLKGLKLPSNPLKYVNIFMPKIADYKYNSETGETYIKWTDLTETRVKPESDTEPNQYVGFVTAYAKKAAGNTSRINNLFEKWAINKPIRDEKSEEKRLAEEAETKRILEKRKAKREKWLIRREAIRIKREYEARKLANEKYGVPMDDECKKEN